MSEIKFQPTQEMAKAQANELVAVLHSRTLEVIAFLLACQHELPSGEPQPWLG